MRLRCHRSLGWPGKQPEIPGICWWPKVTGDPLAMRWRIRKSRLEKSRHRPSKGPWMPLPPRSSRVCGDLAALAASATPPWSCSSRRPQPQPDPGVPRSSQRSGMPWLAREVVRLKLQQPGSSTNCLSCRRVGLLHEMATTPCSG